MSDEDDHSARILALSEENGRLRAEVQKLRLQPHKDCPVMATVFREGGDLAKLMQFREKVSAAAELLRPPIREAAVTRARRLLTAALKGEP